MCRLRRRRLPGPAPAGGPTSCAPKKSAEEGRSRGASSGLPGHRCAPRLRRAPQSGDAHSKRATGATCPFGTNGVPIRAVASRPLWIPRRESPCDPARRAGILRGCLRRMPEARYARRLLKGPRRPFGTRFEPSTAESFVRKRGAKLAPLENPPTAHVQPAAGRRPVPLRPTIRLSESSPGTHGGKQRPFRAFARSARVRGEAAQFSASPWALRATQKRPCLPGSTSGTVPESLGQRHCARGAAA